MGLTFFKLFLCVPTRNCYKCLHFWPCRCETGSCTHYGSQETLSYHWQSAEDLYAVCHSLINICSFIDWLLDNFLSKIIRFQLFATIIHLYTDCCKKMYFQQPLADSGLVICELPPINTRKKVISFRRFQGKDKKF